MFNRKSCARSGGDIQNPVLPCHNRVHLAFNNHGQIGFFNLHFGLINSVKNRAFVKNQRLRSIYILAFIGFFFKITACKTDNRAIGVRDGKHYPAPKTVKIFLFPGFFAYNREPRFLHGIHFYIAKSEKIA